MKVSDVMTRGVDFIDPSATVQEAATQMAELDVGAVLVGTQDEIAGILTDRDIILRVVVDARNPAEVTVREVMSGTIYACAAEDIVESVLNEMRERQIRRMPVYDQDRRPIGIVTLGDLARAVDSPEQLKEALRDIAEPHRIRRTSDSAEPPEVAMSGASRTTAPQPA